jgi:hypothetical protein
MRQPIAVASRALLSGASAVVPERAFLIGQRRLESYLASLTSNHSGDQDPRGSYMLRYWFSI